MCLTLRFSYLRKMLRNCLQITFTVCDKFFFDCKKKQAMPASPGLFDKAIGKTGTQDVYRLLMNRAPYRNTYFKQFLMLRINNKNQPIPREVFFQDS